LVFSRFGKLPIFGRFVPQIIGPIHVAPSFHNRRRGRPFYDRLSPLIAIENRARQIISMRRSDKKAYHPSPDWVTTIEDGCTNHTHFSTLVQVRPARSIFSNALNFCRSAIAALVRSP
jgi:hypothetical protein